MLRSLPNILDRSCPLRRLLNQPELVFLGDFKTGDLVLAPKR